MITAEKAVELIQSPTSSQSNGIDALWVNINPGWGLKYYTKKQQRDRTHELQSLAHSIGIAPAIGDKLDFKIGSDTYYGYTSERIVETCYETMLALQIVYTGKQRDDHFDDKVRHFGHRCDDRMEALREKMEEKFGVRVYDMHHNNFGFDASGEIKIIDFSDCSPRS